MDVWNCGGRGGGLSGVWQACLLPQPKACHPCWNPGLKLRHSLSFGTVILWHCPELVDRGFSRSLFRSILCSLIVSASRFKGKAISTLRIRSWAVSSHHVPVMWPGQSCIYYYILTYFTYAHGSRWSRGHSWPLAVALCCGLLWLFQSSWSIAVSTLLQWAVFCVSHICFVTKRVHMWVSVDSLINQLLDKEYQLSVILLFVLSVCVDVFSRLRIVMMMISDQHDFRGNGGHAGPSQRRGHWVRPELPRRWHSCHRHHWRQQGQALDSSFLYRWLV